MTTTEKTLGRTTESEALAAFNEAARARFPTLDLARATVAFAKTAEGPMAIEE